MNDEIIEQLKENFPVLKELEKNFSFKINEKNELMLYFDNENYHSVTQQDCLELSQLFALLATAFEEVD